MNQKGKSVSRISRSNIFEKLMRSREMSLMLLIVILVIILWISTNTFGSIGNIRVLLQGMSVDMMIAIPMAMALIAGLIDFSVGSILCMSSAAAGIALNTGAQTWLVILVGLGTGCLLGLLNAVIINKLKVTPLVATLGTWMAYRGAALVIIGGSTLANFDESFLIIGRATFFGIPISILYMVIIVAMGLFLIKYIRFFNNAYFIGSNNTSARLAGINTRKFTYVAYTLTGLIAAFAGLTLTARLGSTSQNAGEGLEFRNIVGLLIGGISMDGGEGSIWGAVLGVLLMQLVNNAIVLLYLNPSYTKLITGSILVLAVALDQFGKQRRVRSKKAN